MQPRRVGTAEAEVSTGGPAPWFGTAVGARSWPERAPEIAFFGCLLCVTLGLTLYVRNRTTPGTEQFFDPVLPALALTFPLAGALLVAGRRRNPVVWLLSAGGLSAISFLAEQYAVTVSRVEPGRFAGGAWAGWLSTWGWAPAYLGALTLLPLLFPGGHLPSAAWRPLLWAVIGSIAATCLVAAFAVDNLASPAGSNPLGVSGLPDARGAGEALVLFGLAPVCLGALFLRYRRAPVAERAQLAPFVVAMAAAVTIPIAGLLLALSGIGVPLGLYQAFGVAGVVAVPIAVVRAVAMRVVDSSDVGQNPLLGRALVYGSLSVVAVAAYGSVLVVLGAALPGRVGPGSLAAAVVLGGAVARILRNRIQIGVDRLLYRSRDYDYDVLASLGQRLCSTLGPDAVLPVIAETVGTALKLPYVAIIAGRGPEVVATATYGRVGSGILAVPLSHQSEVVGRLSVAPRGSQPFDGADRRLLDELAAQAGVAAYALCLAADLQRSREKLITAREEERRRLRRDLHDGLKPTLAGVSLGLDAVGNMLRTDAEAADAASLLGRLRCELAGASDDIRRLVHDLRPPALDELGLVGALRQHASRFQLSPTTPDVTLEAPAVLPDLPAAVEVAAYRIGQEALENVRTHAGARSCTVSLRIAEAHLELEVTDDGGGVASGSRAGVGLLAMRERAAELGGSCSIESATGRGTCIRATLPLDSR